MKKVKDNVLGPIARRLGTAITGYLVGLGLPESVVETLVLAVAAVAVIVLELYASRRARKW